MEKNILVRCAEAEQKILDLDLHIKSLIRDKENLIKAMNEMQDTEEFEIQGIKYRAFHSKTKSDLHLVVDNLLLATIFFDESLLITRHISTLKDALALAYTVEAFQKLHKLI